MKRLTIGQLARQSGAQVETVKFYQRRGLIEQPDRPKSGFRKYPPETVRKIRFIRRAKELGFSLQEIGELLDLRVTPGTSCREIKDRAEAKLADIQQKQRDLKRIETILGQLAETCHGRDRSANALFWVPLMKRGTMIVGDKGEMIKTERRNIMTAKRKIKVFSAGCSVCQEAVEQVKQLACSSCEVQVLDMQDPAVTAWAKTLGIRSLPAVAVDGQLADCCTGRGLDENILRAAGIGQPLS